MKSQSHISVQTLHKSLQIARSIARSSLVFISGKARIYKKKADKFVVNREVAQ